MSLRCRDISDRRTLKADHQGSIVAVSTGLNVQPYAYDDYGIPNPGQSGRFQYAGQAWLAPLGMYYYKARIYSPTLGRFLQTDPIGYDDQVNLYAYVGNDPVNGRDPTGLWTCESCSPDELKLAKAFVSGVQAAAGMKGASAELKSVSASLGKFNDAGVNVGFGSLGLDTLGQRQGNNVTLDAGNIMAAANRIQKSGGISPGDALRAVGSSALAHETQHYNDRNSLNRNDQTMRKEMRAYPVQNEVMMLRGVDGNGYDHRYPYDLNVRRQALKSCASSFISRGYSAAVAQASCSNQ